MMSFSTRGTSAQGSEPGMSEPPVVVCITVCVCNFSREKLQSFHLFLIEVCDISKRARTTDDDVDISNSSKLYQRLKECQYVPWLVWLSGFSAALRNEGLLVSFPVKAHAWVGGVQEATDPCISCTLMFLSLLSLPFFPSL